MYALILSAQFLLAATVSAAEVKQLGIILAKDDPTESLTIDEVREIFLKNDASESFVARDMNEGSSERTFFFKSVLRMSESQIREYWGAKMNEGYEEWPRKTSARSMVSFVSRGGRIGYVNAEELSSLPKSEKVKIVLIVE